jgi:hypothetical protein
MKQNKMSVWQWILSIFGKKQKAIQKEANVETPMSDPFSSNSQNEKVKPKFTINEMPEKKVKREFKQKIKHEVIIDGKTHSLTTKQYIFYRCVVTFQGPEDVSGKRIAREFLKIKYNLSEGEVQKRPDWELRLTAHHKTMKYLLDSGIIYKVGKKYRAKV